MSDTSTARRRAPNNSRGTALAAPITGSRASGKAKRQPANGAVDGEENWESDGDADDIDAASEQSRSIRQRKIQPRQHVARSSTPRKQAIRSTPGRVTPVASPKLGRTPSRPVPVDDRRQVGRIPQGPSILSQTASIAFNTVLGLIRLTHTILAPFYPYIFLTVLALLGSSYILYRLNNLIPPALYYLPGRTLRLLTPRWLISPSTSDIALGRSIAYSPLKLLATPACALTGQLCTVSYFNATLAGRWWKGRREPEVNVAEVARRMAKEAQGARDIFESIATLSEGGMMGRLEYVRVWELGAAIQVGSNLEEKEVVSKGLYELGNLARDLSDELVETNALAIDGFTWLQWEFADLVRILELPPTKKPNTQQLSNRLNSVLKRLSDTLSNLHTHASKAHILAQHGSVQGQSLRTELNTIGADLRRAHERAPGWRPALDAAKHLVVGGDPTKEQLISRDLRLTDETIGSISTLVRDLEETRLGIKGFRDQIGFFDASMMGFHLGAGEHIGVGVEEEVQVLSRVVAEFERAIGKAKGPGRESRADEVLEIDA